MSRLRRQQTFLPGVGGGGGGGTVNLAALPTTVSNPNYTTYNALNVPGLAVGGTYVDPQTGVTVLKLTSAASAAGASFGFNYSTFNDQISRIWMSGGAEFVTVALLASNGSQYLLDVNLATLAVSNLRTWPVGEGAFGFSKKVGWERVAYVATGSQLRLYNTATNAFDDTFGSTGQFPQTCTILTWFMCNEDESWFTGLPAFSGTTVEAVRPSTSTRLVRTGQTGMDEMYSGLANVALINRGQRVPYLWNLDTDTITGPIAMPNANTIINHVPSLRGFWLGTDTDSGGGITPFWRLSDAGVWTFAGNFPTFMWQYHWSSHGLQVGDTGTQQYALASMWGAATWTGSLPLAIAFARCDGGDYRAACHSYTIYTGPEDYRALPFAQETADRRAIGFNSNMNDQARYDAFLAFMPVAA